mgnify:CR=1 FL=1
MALTRRRFLQLAAGSTAGAALFVACKFPATELMVQGPAQMPEDLVTGLDNWYATVCRQCPAGCGIIVRVMEGRAKKVAGNPNHPLNQGKLCARGEAAVQALYHPDRLAGPLILKGPRGSGQYERVSWPEALDETVTRLKRLRERVEADTVVMITEPQTDHLALVIDRFARSYGSDYLAYEPLEDVTLRAGIRRTLGQQRLPDLDIEHTRFLVSFGADFLSTWLSPVRYGRGYGEFRQGERDRGTLVQVDSRFSLSAANADVWLPIRPGSEGALALSMAQVIVGEGLGDLAAARAIFGDDPGQVLAAYRPDEAEKATGIPAERIRWLARSFANRRPSMAVAGGSASAHTNGMFNVSAVFALNYLVDGIGKSGGVIPNASPALPDLPELRAAPFSEWQKLAERIRGGQPRPVKLLLIHNANPVYGLPPSVGMADALKKVPDIISFSSFMDETTAFADIILPDHQPLESWGSRTPDPGPGYSTIGFQQPVVRPLLDTAAFPDVLLTIAEELGGSVKEALPWDTFRDVLRDGAAKIYDSRRDSFKPTSFEAFWNGVLQRGVWWDDIDARNRYTRSGVAPSRLDMDGAGASFQGDEAEYPLYLVPFSSSSLREGQGAHLPWLQALPDPVTTVGWQTWVEISRATARELGIEEGDIVSVESPAGTLEAPAYSHPALPPGIVAIPLGQGHTAYGQYASQRGSNPMSILAPAVDKGTGALAWAATRVRLRKTGRSLALPKFEGPVEAFLLPESELFQVERRGEGGAPTP